MAVLLQNKKFLNGESNVTKAAELDWQKDLQLFSISLVHCACLLFKLVRVLDVQARAVCEAQVALIHLGGHEIGYIILIQSRLRVGMVLCGDFRPRTWQGDDKIS